MSKHTPGPWITDKFCHAVSDARDQTICASVRPHHRDTDEQRANIRLMESAPDLLKTLHDINGILTVPAAEYVPAIRDAFKVIDAAIAKATGGEA